MGDHKQLPPTVKSDAAQRQGLAVTLFERLAANPTFAAAGLVFLLNTQYRMNALISSWASASSYQGQLLSHASCADRTVKVTRARPGLGLGLRLPPSDVSVKNCVAIIIPHLH